MQKSAQDRCGEKCSNIVAMITEVGGYANKI